MARMAPPTPTPDSLVGVVSINGGEPVAAQLRITQERIDVSTNLPKPDPRWSFTDAAGHFHAYTEEETTPTLIVRMVHMPCDGSCGGVCDDEGYDATHYHCRICDEEIEPGTIPGPHYDTMPGLMSWEIAAMVPLNGRAGVSVRFEPTAGAFEYFGVALPGEVTIQGGSDGITGRTMLHGVTELGRRTKTVVPAS